MSTNLRLVEQFIQKHPLDAIPYIDELPTDEIATLIDSISDVQVDILMSGLSPYKSGKILELITVDKASSILVRLPTILSTSLLRVADKDTRNLILQAMDDTRANYFRRALSFSTEQVGSYLNPFVLTLTTNMTVDKALLAVKSSKAIVTSMIFVLDSKLKLAGYVALSELLTNDTEQMIKTLVKPVPQSALAEMSIIELLDQWDHRFTDLPVVDIDGQFLGTLSRKSVQEHKAYSPKADNSAARAGNALADLYLIGLTGLLGRPPES